MEQFAIIKDSQGEYYLARLSIVLKIGSEPIILKNIGCHVLRGLHELAFSDDYRGGDIDLQTKRLLILTQSTIHVIYLDSMNPGKVYPLLGWQNISLAAINFSPY